MVTGAVVTCGDGVRLTLYAWSCLMPNPNYLVILMMQRHVAAWLEWKQRCSLYCLLEKTSAPSTAAEATQRKASFRRHAQYLKEDRKR